LPNASKTIAVEDRRTDASTGFLQLPFHFDLPELLHELHGLPDAGWYQHFNTRAYDQGWSALPLRAVGGRMDDIVPIEGGDFHDTAWLAQCPAMARVIAATIDPARFIAESKNPFALSLSKGFDKLSPNGFMNNSCRINKPVYTAPSGAAALGALDGFEQGLLGKKFPTVVAACRRAWDKVIPFFAFDSLRQIQSPEY
jgi:hypothetical protein